MIKSQTRSDGLLGQLCCPRLITSGLAFRQLAPQCTKFVDCTLKCFLLLHSKDGFQLLERYSEAVQVGRGSEPPELEAGPQINVPWRPSIAVCSCSGLGAGQEAQRRPCARFADQNLIHALQVSGDYCVWAYVAGVLMTLL